MGSLSNRLSSVNAPQVMDQLSLFELDKPVQAFSPNETTQLTDEHIGETLKVVRSKKRSKRDTKTIFLGRHWSSCCDPLQVTIFELNEAELAASRNRQKNQPEIIEFIDEPVKSIFKKRIRRKKKQTKIFVGEEWNRQYSNLNRSGKLLERDVSILESTKIDNKDAYETAFLNVLYAVQAAIKQIANKAQKNMLPYQFEKEYDRMAQMLEKI